MHLRRNRLRPSSVDHQIKCGWFYSTDGLTNEALANGQSADDAYRGGIRMRKAGPLPNEVKEWVKKAHPTNWEGVAWAINETFALAKGTDILCEKDECKVEIPGFPSPGEVDSGLPIVGASCDLKTGIERDYHRQQACYAYGLMLAHWRESWTVYVLYMDLQKVKSYTYTFAEAEQIVLEAIKRHAEPGEPTYNPSCNWCANYDDCPAIALMVDKAMGHMNPEFDFAKLKEDPEQLGEWLSLMYPIAKDQGLYQKAKSAARKLMDEKQSVPGWSPGQMKGDEMVSADEVLKHVKAEDLPVYIKTAYKSVEKDKFLKAVKAAELPIPDRIEVHRGPDIKFVQHRETKPKKEES